MLYLRKEDIRRLGGDSPGIYIDAVGRALTCHAEGDFVQPLKPYLRVDGAGGHVADRIIAMPAHIGSPPTSGLKWIGSKHDNPARRGLERASALIILNDPETNYPVAVMEGGLISGMRTAAVTALAARHLARDRFRSVACVGCGTIARMQLMTLLEQFASVETLHLFDLEAAAANSLAEEISAPYPVSVRRAASAEEAVRKGEVVVTCTVTDRPYVEFDWLRRGVFVSNVSIMDVKKGVYLKVDKLVVDDWDQSNREKKILHQLVQEGRLTREQLHAELGEIIVGRKPGRESEDERILLNPMGMAIEDIACARALYDRALSAGVGTWLELY
jgi:ornithine cyclodeaminase